MSLDVQFWENRFSHQQSELVLGEFWGENPLEVDFSFWFSNGESVNDSQSKGVLEDISAFTSLSESVRDTGFGITKSVFNFWFSKQSLSQVFVDFSFWSFDGFEWSDFQNEFNWGWDNWFQLEFNHVGASKWDHGGKWGLSDARLESEFQVLVNVWQFDVSFDGVWFSGHLGNKRSQVFVFWVFNERNWSDVGDKGWSMLSGWSVESLDNPESVFVSDELPFTVDW